MGSFVIIFLTAILILTLLYLLDQKRKQDFESKGISYQGNGTYHFIRNRLTGVGFREGITVNYNRMKTSSKAKVSGGIEFGQPILMILDPEIIKHVLIKDFDYFSDRRIFITSKKDYLFGKTLIALKDDHWKALRSKLSPTFTTGKIKRLYPLFNASGKKLVQFIEDEIANSPEIDLSNVYSKFTMDIIASSVCGMDSQAFEQKGASLFEQMGMKLQLKFGGLDMLKILTMVLAPKLSDFLGFSVFGKDVQDFFSGAIKSSIKERTKAGEKRNDFIQLMLDAREDKLKMDETELDNFEKDALIKNSSSLEKISTAQLLDDNGIVANCVLFILAGFDTTQSLLLFCAYALALNQDVQDKLRIEVDSVLDENDDGEFSYEALHKMTYLDMVINETLRFYPPAGMTDRTATQDYKIPGTDYIVKKGNPIQISIAGLHHDPEYYQDPEKFDPERFSVENKGKIHPYTFLPFGEGPRNCIGRRFALTEVKVAISHLIHNFKIEPSKMTMIPMKYADGNSLKPKNGMFLALNATQH